MERAAHRRLYRLSARQQPQRGGRRLVIVGRTFTDRKLWRPALDALRLSLELREVADVRAPYEKMREDHGFRLLDYSVDADSASPRACFQFSEEAARQAHRFLAVRRGRRPGQAGAVRRRQAALRRRPQARRALQRDLRAGLPSTVKETLPKSADLDDLCARPQGRSCASPARPTCCRAPASAASRSSASTPRRSNVEDLPHQRPQPDRDRARPRLPAQPRPLRARAADRGAAASSVWNGELAVEQTLNAEVTTAFPVDQAVGDLAPGVYVMTAAAEGHRRRDDYDALVDAVVHRLRHRPRGLFGQRRHQRVRQFAGDHRAEGPGRGAADAAQQRNPGDQADRRRGPRRLRGRAVARRGRACRPPCWSPPTPRATTPSST